MLLQYYDPTLSPEQIKQLSQMTLLEKKQLEKQLEKKDQKIKNATHKEATKILRAYRNFYGSLNSDIKYIVDAVERENLYVFL